MPTFHFAAASPLRLSSTSTSLPYVTAGAISLGLLLIAKSILSLEQTSSVEPKNVLRSPRTTLLPQLSSDEVAGLPYPPDVLPGARDVETPYGSLRVYEWGPEEGKKVLLVHGISTPCVALAGIAEELVKRGRRVMLFDLFGRGYSDAPTDLPYDARLYTTQILLALASSPLPWTGTANAFSILGYSLGGGIAADFTSHFPHLISTLILIAPGGLIRPSHISWKSKLLYNSPLPASLVNHLVARRLYTPPTARTATPSTSASTSASATDAAQAEAGQRPRAPPARARSSSTASHPAPLLPHRPAVTAAAAVNWQVAAHPGFAHAFVSSIRHAPVYGQHARWRVIGARLTAGRAAREASGGEELPRKSVCLVLGREDPIVVVDEVRADVEDVLGGPENVQTVVLEAGHEVPMSRAREVAEALIEFWEGA